MSDTYCIDLWWLRQRSLQCLEHSKCSMGASNYYNAIKFKMLKVNDPPWGQMDR